MVGRSTIHQQQCGCGVGKLVQKGGGGGPLHTTIDIHPCFDPIVGQVAACPLNYRLVVPAAAGGGQAVAVALFRVRRRLAEGEEGRADHW
jgi:hypothetical protein